MDVACEGGAHIFVTVGTGLVADITCAFNCRHAQHFLLQGSGGACADEKQQGKQLEQPIRPG